MYRQAMFIGVFLWSVRDAAPVYQIPENPNQSASVEYCRAILRDQLRLGLKSFIVHENLHRKFTQKIHPEHTLKKRDY